jgi:hypothetical protein
MILNDTGNQRGFDAGHWEFGKSENYTHESIFLIESIKRITG